MIVLSLREAQEAQGQLKHWAYNALDATGTREVSDELLPRMSPARQRTYAFERAQQGPALTIAARGIAIDELARARVVKDLTLELSRDVRSIDKMPQLAIWDGVEKETGFCAVEVLDKKGQPDGKAHRHKWPKGVDSAVSSCERCGTRRQKRKPFNANSTEQIRHLLHDLLDLPVMYNKTKEVSVDDDILERIGQKFPTHFDLTQAIRGVKAKKKQLGFLKARLVNGRYMTTFNVGAAWTGRGSASMRFGSEGGNTQNIAERHRNIFIPDPGYEIGYADLKTAESNVVAHLAGDPVYIDAHRSGDVHTYVTRLLWPRMAWTGDLARDKAIAKALPPWDQAPGHDWRFQAKRIQHGSNFGLTPFGISMLAHIPQREAEGAQRAFFTEFAYVRGWQREVERAVREQRELINPLGRGIFLTGRPWDMHTIRQGYSFLPQSTVADIINLALWRVWRDLDPALVQVLAQVHDAILFQFPRGRIEDVACAILDRMSIPVEITDPLGVTRTLTIGVEIAYGRNWGHASSDNPNGMVTYDFA